MQAAPVVSAPAGSPTPVASGTDRGASRIWGVVIDIVLVTGCAAIAAAMRQDANWDQLQYHYWYPWQLFHGGFTDPDLYGGRFQNPLPQVPFYLLVTYLSPLAAQAALGALAGVSVVLVRRIAVRVLRFTGGWAVAVSTTVALLAAVGAGFRSELATSYSDVLLASLLLGALLLILRGNALPAGLLAGAAVGLKYTSAPFAVASLVALLVVGAPRLRRTAWWVVGAAVGWLLTGGVWAWQLWRIYESPVFPFWNTVFASPWYPAANLTDERYGVSGWQQWLTWPLDMAAGQARVLDLPVRDVRWLLLTAALALIVIGARRVSRQGWAMIAFTLVGTVVWLAVFGVIRYAIPAEMLVAVIVALAVSLFAGPRTTLVVTAVFALAAGLWTLSAQGRRIDRTDQWYQVSPAAFAVVAPGDAVLVDGQYPSTFTLPGQLPSGAHVHVVQKDFTGTPLREWLAADLAESGQVWVVTDKPQSQVNGVIGTIDYDNCTKIETNVVNRWLCPVTL